MKFFNLKIKRGASYFRFKKIRSGLPFGNKANVSKAGSSNSLSRFLFEMKKEKNEISNKLNKIKNHHRISYGQKVLGKHRTNAETNAGRKQRQTTVRTKCIKSRGEVAKSRCDELADKPNT